MLTSYESTLEAAGAEVLSFKEFGSYQGEWLAKVNFNNEIGWVRGYYGSCSGCDALQAEFNYTDEPEFYQGKWYKNGNTWDDEYVITEEEAQREKQLFQDRLCNFGKSYLDALYSQDMIEKLVSENIEWDSSAEDMLKFVKENSI